MQVRWPSPPSRGRALLACHLGPKRVSGEPRAIADLINHCARWPLVLAIVAAWAPTHPGFALGILAKELAHEHNRLDALDTGPWVSNSRWHTAVHWYRGSAAY